MVSSKVGHNKLPKFLESKVSWKTRITQSRRGKWMWSPTDKKRRFIQALQYDNRALQMPQWSENLQSVLEAWGFSIHKSASWSTLGTALAVISPSKPNRKHLCWTTTSKYLCCCMNRLNNTPSIRAVPTDPKWCPDPFLPSAVLSGVRKKYNNSKSGGLYLQCPLIYPVTQCNAKYMP